MRRWTRRRRRQIRFWIRFRRKAKAPDQVTIVIRGDASKAIEQLKQCQAMLRAVQR